MKRYFIGSLILIALIAVLIFTFYTRENRRGADAWADTKSYLESQGETLSFATLIPSLPPPEENFCATPLVASMTDFEQTSGSKKITYRNPEMHDRIVSMRLPDVVYPETKPAGVHPETGRLPDFEGWATLLAKSGEFPVSDRSLPPAGQILLALEKFESEFSELSGAAGRPQAVFDFEWDDSVFGRMAQRAPHRYDALDLSRLLALRSTASLSAGRPATARRSIAVMLRFSEALYHDPHLISFLIGASIDNLALNTVWYGLKRESWRQEDLDWIAGRFTDDRLFEGALRALRGEMVSSHIDVPEWQRELESGVGTGGTLLDGGGWFDLIDEWLPVAMVPDGWWDLNKSEGCRISYDEWIEPLKRRDFSKHRMGSFWYERKRPFTVFLAMNAGNGEKPFRNVAQMAAKFRCARVACVLEQVRRETGKLPESLSELVPDRIAAVPSDPIDGKPLRYRRTADGHYRLYSIGFDGIDDDGDIRMNPGEKKPDPNSGDWVWTYSFPEPEEDP